MSTTHPPGRRWCPCCIAEVGLALLARGRLDMAATLMRDLPERIGAALDEVYERRVADGRRAAARGKPAAAGAARRREPPQLPAHGRRAAGPRRVAGRNEG